MREGLCNLVISTRTRLVGASVVSGYNYFILCGSSSLDNRIQMSDRFGAKIIKISDVKGFAEEVRSILGARRYFLGQLLYDDLNIFQLKTLKSWTAGENVPNPQAINDSIFDLLYGAAFFQVCCQTN